MEAFVDKDTCIGCGLCESICPEVFKISDDGKATVIVEEIPDSLADSAKNAESQCPVNAIRIE